MLLKTIDSSSVWKPLHGPVTDWPLALCDASTVNPDIDFVAADIVNRDGYTENSRIHYSDQYKFYYLSEQKASEALIFRQFDTRPNTHGTFHALRLVTSA